MPVCGSVGGGGNLYGSGIGYHGNILLKTNAGAGEAQIEGLIYWEGRGEKNHGLNAQFYRLCGIYHKTVKNSKVVKTYMKTYCRDTVIYDVS